MGWCTELPKRCATAPAAVHRVGYFEIHLERLLASARSRDCPIRAQPLSGGGAPVHLGLPEEFTFAELEMPDAPGGRRALCGIALDSIYRGEQLAAGRKAVSLRIFLQSYDQRTLEDKDLLGPGRIISQHREAHPGPPAPVAGHGSRLARS
jgi:hypothetical protein